ncbi:hypothetical protein EVAR_59915_1 [Eumeta japonica]|uniref:Uncharacterized protein n=1 Tax=Eumeta variegata TaxID=151549 RepID=A0A4C1YNS6_EUMVA|nr:hypothetical protein EVAR_59915_1 [Eumeta japonica]
MTQCQGEHVQRSEWYQGKHFISLMLRVRVLGEPCCTEAVIPLMDLWVEKAKLKRQEKIANESDVYKRQRLEKIRLAEAKHRENELLEQRTNRQDINRIHAQERRKNELLEQRTKRQDTDRIHTRERRKNSY